MESESEYDYRYSSGSDAGSDAGFADAEVADQGQRKARFAIYREDHLRERQEEAVQQVVSVLGLPPTDAARVLRHFKWDASRVNEEWWADEDGVRRKLGLPEPPAQPPPKPRGKAKCGICFEEFRASSMLAAACRHSFCKDCWRGFVGEAVQRGTAALDLRCPVPGCGCAVPGELMREVCGAEEWARLQRFALRSFVDDSASLAWCPAPDCSCAAEALADSGGAPLDVACACGAAFCFTCREEAHRPVDCATVRKWVSKNSAESENLNWILANTKPCPACKRPIEKNQGCMHMTCSQCSHQFCWLCLAAWATHGEGTGGFYACNRYELAKQRGEFDEEAQRREHAKQALERYMHYYQRWAENDKARAAAQRKLQATQEVALERLAQLYGTPTSQLKFVTDAWQQVVDCRRVLRWTYAYGYYSFDAGAAGQPARPPALLRQQQAFFEFNQGQAEFFLERLHGVAEREMEALAAAEEGAADAAAWAAFRERLIGLTDVTRSHLEKLVQELEKGLDRMMGDYNEPQALETEPAAAAPPPARPPPAPRRARALVRSTSPAPAQAAAPRRTRAAQRSAPGRAADAPLQMDAETEAAVGFWLCAACTFANPDLGADACEICEAPRVRGGG